MSRPRVALTQSPRRLEELQPLLEASGFEVVRRPLLRTVPRCDDRTSSLAARLLALPWLLVTSRSTVEALVGLGAVPIGPLVGAVGPGTAAALAAIGVEAALVGIPNDAGGLARTFLAHPEARGPVGLPRGNRALTTLERDLGEAGIATMPLIVYDTVVDEESAAGCLSDPAVAALPAGAAASARLVTLGGTTSSAARERGWSCEEATEATAEAAAAAVERVVT